MKKSGRKFLKGTNWALAGLLSFLGFSGCGGMATEYGTPYAEYEVKGTVTDEVGKAISDIQVDLAQRVQEHRYIKLGSPSITNRAGHYAVSAGTFPGQELTLIVTDTDGEANGSYASDTIAVRFEKKDYYKKGKGWFEGAARKTVDIKLKPKK